MRLLAFHRHVGSVQTNQECPRMHRQQAILQTQTQQMMSVCQQLHSVSERFNATMTTLDGVLQNRRRRDLSSATAQTAIDDSEPASTGAINDQHNSASARHQIPETQYATPANFEALCASAQAPAPLNPPATGMVTVAPPEAYVSDDDDDDDYDEQDDGDHEQSDGTVRLEERALIGSVESPTVGELATDSYGRVR